MPIFIRDLMVNQSNLITISPSQPVRDALELMLEYKFSQLPVVENSKHQGLITSDSIVSALLTFSGKLDDIRVEQALEKAVEVREDDELFDVIDEIISTYAVVVSDKEGKSVGIITAYDMSQYFRGRAETMIWLEEIEGMLKSSIKNIYKTHESEIEMNSAMSSVGNSKSSQREKCIRAIKEIVTERKLEVDDLEIEKVALKFFKDDGKQNELDGLTLNDFIQLVQKKKGEASNIFKIGDKLWEAMLNDVRESRNKIMHFRGDLTAIERTQIRRCFDWFKTIPYMPIEDYQPESSEENDEPPVDAPSDSTSVDTKDTAINPDNILSIKEAESKYTRLSSFLRDIPSGISRKKLSFKEIEQVIGAELPKSARSRPSWWANDSSSHVQSRQWLEASWAVEEVDMTLEEVTFVRHSYRPFFERVVRLLDGHDYISTDSIKLRDFSFLTVARTPLFGTRRASLNVRVRSGSRFELKWLINAGEEELNDKIYEGLVARRQEVDAKMPMGITWSRSSIPSLKGAIRLVVSLRSDVEYREENFERLSQMVAQNTMMFHDAVVVALKEVLSSIAISEDEDIN